MFSVTSSFNRIRLDFQIKNATSGMDVLPAATVIRFRSRIQFSSC